MAQPRFASDEDIRAYFRANPDATIDAAKEDLRVGYPRIKRAQREVALECARTAAKALISAAEGRHPTPEFSEGSHFIPTGTAPASGPARAPDGGGTGTLTRALEGETSRASIGLGLPESPREVVSEYPTIQDGVLVISDLHVPTHSKEWLERVVAYAVGKNVRRLLIAGDLLDGTNMGKHPSNGGEVFEQELELARQVVAWLRQYFSEITVFSGNHDAWFARKVDGQISAAKLLEWVCGDGVKVIRFHEHCYVGERWLVSHPGVYSRMPSKPAYDLCAIFHRNVAVAHTHKVAMARDISGKYWALEMGMMGDPRRVAYVHQTLRAYPRHQQGALIIHEGGRPELLHPDLI